MRRSRFLPLGLAALMLATAPGAVEAQTIHSVSTETLEIVPGTRDLTLRIDGSDLGGVTEAQFLKDGRVVRGISSRLQASDRSITRFIAAEESLNPLAGIDVELRGPRLRRAILLPVKTLVASVKTGAPVSSPPADDASIQVQALEMEENRVYVGGTVNGIVRLTATSSEPVEIEIVSERPQSLEVPGVVVVPAGQLQTSFQVRGVSEYVYYGDPWMIELQARKVPFTSGPIGTVTVFDAPTPGLALFPNVGPSGFDMGDATYGPPPAATPVSSGESRVLKIRLVHEPVIGGTLQLSASGPASVQSSVSIPPGEDRIVNVPVNFGTVASPQSATVTVTGYGVSTTASISVYPDQVVVTSVTREGGYGTSASVTGGDAVRLEVKLSQPAPTGGYTVPVQASDPAAVAVPSLTIPAGATSGVLIVGTQSTTTHKTVTLTIGELSPQTFTITISPSE